MTNRNIAINGILVNVATMGLTTPQGLEIVCIRPLGKEKKDGSRKLLKQHRAGVIMDDGTVQPTGQWMQY